MTQQANTHWQLLLIGFASFVVIGAPVGVLNVAWQYMEGTFGVTLEAIGVFLLATMIGRMAAMFSGGQIIPRIGLGSFLLLGSALLGLGLLGHALAPGWALLLLAAASTGCGSGMVDSGMNNYVAGNYPPSRVNWLHGMYGLGQTLGPLLVSFLVITLAGGWQGAYVTLAAACALMVLAFGLTRRRWRVPTDTRESVERPDRVSIRASLAVPAVILSMALYFVYAGVEVGTGQLTPRLLQDGRGMDPATVSGWISLYWGSLTAGRLLLGFIADRLRPTQLLRLSMIGAVLGTLLIWAQPFEAASMIGLALTGLAIAPFSPTMIGTTPARVGRAHTANAIGFQFGAASLGWALLTGLGGTVSERFGVGAIGPFLVILPLAMLLLHEFMVLRSARQARIQREAV